MNDVLLLLAFLFVKHFIVDFPLQRPYQWMNKGRYGHLGGLLHAGLHGVGTALCMWWYAPLLCLVLGCVDALVHYHIDWAKMNINKQCGWDANKHEEFWWLLGIDQLLHALTYIVMIAVVI